jgi:hypothetical protein
LLPACLLLREHGVETSCPGHRCQPSLSCLAGGRLRLKYEQWRSPLSAALPPTPLASAHTAWRAPAAASAGFPHSDLGHLEKKGHLLTLKTARPSARTAFTSRMTQTSDLAHHYTQYTTLPLRASAPSNPNPPAHTITHCSHIAKPPPNTPHPNPSHTHRSPRTYTAHNIPPPFSSIFL